MKRSLSLLIPLLLLFATVSSYAQSRIAYLDATKLLKRLPEAVDAEARLDQMVMQWNKELSDMEADLKRKRDDYERKKLIMTDAERGAVEVDVSDLKKRVDQYRQDKYGANGELYKQQADLMKPAYEKLMKAIEEVAVEGKYDYVLDRSSKDFSMLYTNAKFDLSAQVAKKLGLETNDIFNVPLINNPLNPNKPGATNQNPNNPANSNPKQPPPGTPPPPPGGFPPGTQQPPIVH
jgi:outer membrane protein